MLASGKMVGFIPTKDYDKARAFYEGKLGLEFVSLDKFALVMTVGGHMIRIVKIPNFTPLQGTILGWQVENIESVAAWLRDRGVPPEKYPFAQDQNLGIWSWAKGYFSGGTPRSRSQAAADSMFSTCQPRMVPCSGAKFGIFVMRIMWPPTLMTSANLSRLTNSKPSLPS